ncbi:Glycosyltransferase, GT2 family [Cellulosimicrobium cellulans]|nr:Glycosyltransferase, GT2 family [Cellulosimicrobium cellulans]
MPNPEVSVVIGFKNWGLERLSVCLASLRATTYEGGLQIVVSDYGSDRPEDVRRVAEEWGADYVWSAPLNGWSRAGAVNAGISATTGDIVVATDADMLFRPGTFDAVAEAIARNPQDVVILQCRDLPRGYSDAEIDPATIDWEHISAVAQIRPRWGMGGFIASARETVLRVRGLDERLHTYGGEDIDFATRCRRSGSRIQWLDDERARIYHMWHEPTLAPGTSDRDREVARAVTENRKIYQEDQTVVRNLRGSEYISAVALPACSLILRDRTGRRPGPALLESVLGQSVAAIEVLVPSYTDTDTSAGTDPRRMEAWSPGDARVREIDMPSEGRSATGRDVKALVEQARGAYVLIEDADAFYGTRRIEEMLGGAVAGISATLGSSVKEASDGAFERLPLGFGDVLFERRALLAALETLPEDMSTAKELVDHLTQNGAASLMCGSIGRLVRSVPDECPPLTSWAHSLGVDQSDAPRPLSDDEVASAGAMLESLSEPHVFLWGSSDRGAVDSMSELVAAGSVGSPQSLVVREPSSGVEYFVQASVGTTFADARRIVRASASLPNVQAEMLSGDGTMGFDALNAVAALLSATYGASLAENNWLLVTGPGAVGDPVTTNPLAAELGVANALSRTLISSTVSEPFTLYGPLRKEQELRALLVAAETLPLGASVRLLGPVPEVHEEEGRVA